ncbi:MAG: ATP-dependent RNA helicase [Pseudomonadales bacterium]|jgi:ATP-dependent RNA helicase DeaD|uniref:DEAD/DEAH box helicase n=1 Tax=unclassified Ketobacter TaxID=2639109 RepID=UPI000C6AD7FD|nr:MULTISPECIES: DEAD/DEAH box helicase [unclassified Ketobacter]MAQ25665.1 ATP-dependent RNA helicase [Pseudomonadales bacterium]MEC8809779.1 DEAD/DEAH box helicase [Pseudomonadota bacterium]TNC88134.1 MAG: ATP-dependent RNA helicase [Alcanivorax sp.]HAU14472.1 ATP-dependent RNA helicase [Gammaproteobacteria bacterium]MBI25633.1 ATP-dependent RNA helicase [Pseudomonadales bacterium]|tara:strand:- start:1246 stop:3138 length:1893 start_codon:yes stop_codon:yes gene_type:complete
MSDTEPTTSFETLGMPDFVLKTLSELGYESPSPIQAASIPVFMSGADLIGQAQTGTGKTAAFALPVLAQLDDALHKPQALILTPTRELAIQVAEAFQRYARYRKGFRIAPIYGGQDFRPQLKLLKQGVQVVVGTPGRLLDHLRRGTLDISEVKTLVLDEADEMLRMGFIDDVEDILSHCSGEQQTALFSATMPAPIKRIADKYLTEPQHVHIQAKTATVERIDQSYWLVDGRQKPEALRRYLETRNFDAVIVFVRTRENANEVAEKVNAWGYRAEAIHGAISQSQREKTINGLKKSRFDILVATDVAARGLDVDRFSHVVNYDIPHDSESYVHRIGRTGRAGRSGETVLFVTHRENRLLKLIERHTKQKIERAHIPNNDVVLQQRVERFKQQVAEQAAKAPSALIQSVVEQCCHDLEIEPELLAGVLINMLHAEHPLEPKEEIKQARERSDSDGKPRRGELRNDEAPIATAPNPLQDFPDVEMERFRIEVGRRGGVTPRDIVGAIANEAGIESNYIGDIILRNEFSTIDLPSGMPKELFNQMKKIRVRGAPIRITRYGKEAPEQAAAGSGRPKRDAGKGEFKKGEFKGKKKFADKKKPGAKSRFGDKPPAKKSSFKKSEGGKFKGGKPKR